MRNVKVWVSKFLAGAMAMVCVVGSSAPMYSYAAETSSATIVSEVASEDSTVHYVALGDSITAGNSTYVSKVSDYLERSYGECVTNNLAVDGWDSNNLLDALTNPANSRYSAMRKAISNADVITLDIGSNDIFITAINKVAECFGTTPDQMGVVSEQWTKRIQNASGFQMFLIYLEAMKIAQKINYELNQGDTMPNAIANFESNYKTIIATIKTLAPNAKLYVGNLYNPYVDAASMYLGNYEFLNVEQFAKANVCKANAIIANNVNGYVIVDLYNTINDPKYIKGDVVNYDYDPHPNATGQEAIAAKFIAAIKSGK